MTNKTVSVVVPTYNRAHLLGITLPTYLQDEVLELIVVNDASNDNTDEVLQELCKKYDRIKYITNKKNLKQTGSKNIGIIYASGPYIYFGDDDSILLPGSIKSLLNTRNEFAADIVGAKAIYMKTNETINNSILRNSKCVSSTLELFNPYTFEHNFNLSVLNPTKVLICQACFLIDGHLARSNKFFTGFIGPCQREESDYLLRLLAQGKNIYFDSNAIQINLPRTISTGGSWGNWLYREISLFYNHTYFSIRNYKILSEISNNKFFLNYFIFIYVKKFIFIKTLVNRIFKN